MLSPPDSTTRFCLFPPHNRQHYLAGDSWRTCCTAAVPCHALQRGSSRPNIPHWGFLTVADTTVPGDRGYGPAVAVCGTEPWHDPRSCLTGCSSTDHMTRGTFPPSHRQQRIPSNLHHHLLHPSLTVHVVTACVTHPLPAALGRHQPVQKVEVDLAPVDAGHVLEIRPESQTIKSLHWKILSLE